MHFFCPGRVNLIGEHLDYNGGLVMPAAIAQGIRLRVAMRNDDRFGFASSLAPDFALICAPSELDFDPAHGWANYPKGVLQALGRQGESLPGMDLFFESDLPVGAGLSSSAAIEVLTGFAALVLSGQPNPDRLALAQLCQRVENQYIGVNCGIMDQFAVALGQTEQAILLDCSTLAYRYVPIVLGEYRLVIMNTCKPRRLVASKYNERRAECEAVNLMLSEKLGPAALAQRTFSQLAALDLPPDAVLARRARHVISEQQRVVQAASALASGDLRTFGLLLNASHASLRTDYEVTGLELDTLAEAAQAHPGCLGARMTGAGFGGCAIGLVHIDALHDFELSVGAVYAQKTGLNAAFYAGNIGQGVAQMS